MPGDLISPSGGSEDCSGSELHTDKFALDHVHNIMCVYCQSVCCGPFQAESGLGTMDS